MKPAPRRFDRLSQAPTVAGLLLGALLLRLARWVQLVDDTHDITYEGDEPL